ncbi:hypothetical protein B6F84_11665 [Acidianus manzaensis]|uniref:Uncharacterized protein n=1 Tax=Acidianus manzaensis TaxID=282676 RepID=A0A1W6K230_9CREN|nr:hypothetical protein B6F84_11665 [Acidianus manzaensis]
MVCKVFDGICCWRCSGRNYYDINLSGFIDMVNVIVRISAITVVVDPMIRDARIILGVIEGNCR